MYAHYFETEKTKFVIMSHNYKPDGLKIPVSSKSEAYRVARNWNATCWNF